VKVPLRIAAGISALIVASLAPATASASSGGAFPGAVNATVGPLISGTSSYVHGTYAWTGYAYNDTTAYPSGVAGNSANLIQLQVGLTSGGDMRIRAILETLTDPTVPLLAVGFDTDGNPQTGAASLPGWSADGPLGLDWLVTVGSQGTTLEHWNGSAWTVAGHYPSEIDPTSNSMTAVIPRSALNPDGQTWDAVAAVGLNGADSWLSGDGSIYNLAFVHEEACEIAADAACDPTAIAAGTGWQDGESNLILAGKAPSSAAVASIDFATIAERVTDLASAGVPGFHTLLYYSHLNLGEGFLNSTCIADVDPCEISAGPYQPYIVEVPQSNGGRLPVVFFLHGVDANFLWPYEPLPDPGLGAVVEVFPFGRGESVGWGGGDAVDGTPTLSGAYGEQDVLDVYSDVMHRLNLDPNRVIMTGTSLGGLGALHVAEFHPDLFAGVYSEVGGDCCIVSTNHAQPRRLENLINLPLRMTNGTLDPLANAADALTDFYPAIDSLRDVDFLGFQLLRRTHDISETSYPENLLAGTYGTVAQCLIQQMLATPRVINPARVVYIVDPNFEFTDPATGLDVVHTHAYWVSDLHPRGSDEARIDVTTLTRAVRTTTATPLAGTGQNITSSGDLCGANPDVQTDDAWAYQGIKLTPGAAQPTSNGFTATITQFATATLDLPRMGISVAEPITATIGGDGVTALTLRGPWRDGERIAVTRDGAPDGTITAADGAVVLDRDFSWQQESVPDAGMVDFSGVEPPAYIDTPAGDVSGDQEPEGRVIAAHDYVLTPQPVSGHRT
jgi:pimeloyl-ACP methyl ester carboxylesterase